MEMHALPVAFRAKIRVDASVQGEVAAREGRVGRLVEGNCWMWTGCARGGMNAESRYGGYREGYAHRFAYETLVGPIPEDLEIDHLCRVRFCVRPDHMEPVTHAENGRRGESVFGANARKTHCDSGHEFTADNTIIDPRGRKCRECKRGTDEARRARRAGDGLCYRCETAAVAGRSTCAKHAEVNRLRAAVYRASS